ncbi:polymorphic toxin-type HINT domain-containing protein [Nocardiopsis chromatogenes]|uniref:polymorphic toxin-type HINT domain-containing protein n=1 Tax=Nocardiopsis chromatogenes TaxID=280239 RepID=UPI000349F81F|nr:polymorphic toxin-type HINT domain-containing protein [Nocardiopsis chromatogenes]
MRWVWRAETGAFKLEYGALILLVAVIVAAVFALGLPVNVREYYVAAICRISPESEDCGRVTGGADDPSDEPSGDPSDAPSGEPSDAPSDSPAPSSSADGTEWAEEGSGPDVDFDPAVYNELQDAEEELADAEDEEAEAQDEYDDNYDELLDLVGDLIGYNDARDCITKGDIMACLWTVVGLSPWGKGAKLVKNSAKILRLWNRWRRTKRAKEAAEETLSTARQRADEALEACELNSFVPGTLVLTADGSRAPIEEVDPGDLVVATDPVTGETRARPVVRTITGSGTKELVDIRVFTDAGVERVTATAGHPFWVQDAWVEASDLRPGDLLTASDGSTATVASISVTTWWATVHNLTVSGLSTYYVSAGGVDLLTHNCNFAKRPGQIAQALDYSTKQIKQAIEKVKQGGSWRGDGARRNPDIVVDVDTGEVYPQLPDGSPAEDSIGNIFEHLPEN